MLQNSYSPAFPLKHQQKDMRLALALGDENAIPMPVASAANEVILFLPYIFLLCQKMTQSEIASLVHRIAIPVNILNCAQTASK